MFYDRFLQLCRQKGVSPSRAAEDIGLSRASVMKWKRGAMPGGASLNKLSAYFGITVDSLINGSAPAPLQGGEPQDELIAFYGLVKDDLDEQDRQDLITFMRMKAEIKRTKRYDPK